MKTTRQICITLFWGWLIPGAGHFYIGQKWKGIALGCLLSLLYLAGLSLADYRNVSWQHPFSLLGYSFTGSFTAFALIVRLWLDNIPQWSPFAYQLGCLYMTIASLLNLLILLHLADAEDEI